MRYVPLPLTLLTVLSIAIGAFAAESNMPVGRQVANFTLQDYRGKEHSLDDFSDSKAVVVVFLGTECPLVKLYAPRLTALAEEFAARGVAFVGINSNRQDSITKIAHYCRIHTIKFPVLKDLGNKVADEFGAVRTPEVFVLDQQRTIRYWGRIDDQYGVGFQKPKFLRRDLAEALDELLLGKPISQSVTEAPGCFIGRVQKIPPTGDVTYSNQIARIIQNRCEECHRDGEIAPFALNSYEDVVGWADTMREVIHDGRMPPWFANPDYGGFKNDKRMTGEEKRLFNSWIDNGCPEGDSEQLPEPRGWVSGWGIPQPDEVIYIQDSPVNIPAEGVVDYQYYTVDPGWTEDKWIQAAEARPDNRAVVHHIIVFFKPPPGARARGFREQGAVSGYAPGMPPFEYKAGTASFVPAGSKLVFQMHYTPNGSPQKDRSFVGIKFADPKTVKYRIHGGMAPNFLFAIPPGADNYEITSRKRFRQDTLLLTLTPHMHLRGKSFRYEAIYPDGRREVLLDIPRYDFNWQLRYELAEPKFLPKGTKLFCTAHFDNSEENLANPDPTETVHWGDQTWEEMMIGWYTTRDIEEVPAEMLSGK